jgi:muconolactone delta-isomerase
MQFMVLFSRDPSKANETPPSELRNAEFQRVRQLYAEGLVQQVWLRGDAGGACMIAEAPNAETLAQAFSTLPLVKAGTLLAPMIVPLKPYSGFSPAP